MLNPITYWKNAKPRVKYQLVAGILFFVFVAIVLPIAAVTNIRASQSKTQSSATGLVDPNTLDDNWDGLAVYANVSTIDPVSYKVKLQFLVFPVGKFRADEANLFDLSVPVKFHFDRVKTTFEAGEHVSLPDVDAWINDGDVNLYPMDHYQSFFRIYASYTVGNATRPIPIALSVTGAVQSWNIVTEVSKDPFKILVGLYLSRSLTTKVFAALIGIIMWLLSLSMLLITITYWLKNLKIEPPIICLSASLLFALPALRSAQVGAPVIGCTSDVLSFFWAIMFVGISTVLLMSKHMLGTYYQSKSDFDFNMYQKEDIKS